MLTAEQESVQNLMTVMDREGHRLGKNTDREKRRFLG